LDDGYQWMHNDTRLVGWTDMVGFEVNSTAPEVTEIQSFTVLYKEGKFVMLMGMRYGSLLGREFCFDAQRMIEWDNEILVLNLGRSPIEIISGVHEPTITDVHPDSVFVRGDALWEVKAVSKGNGIELEIAEVLLDEKLVCTCS